MVGHVTWVTAAKVRPHDQPRAHRLRKLRRRVVDCFHLNVWRLAVAHAPRQVLHTVAADTERVRPDASFDMTPLDYVSRARMLFLNTTGGP